MLKRFGFATMALLAGLAVVGPQTVAAQERGNRAVYTTATRVTGVRDQRTTYRSDDNRDVNRRDNDRRDNDRRDNDRRGYDRRGNDRYRSSVVSRYSDCR